ncbi:MAG: hypothetical protein ACTSW1_08675 [Candidatus Hodarchaeales archaeon]
MMKSLSAMLIIVLFWSISVTSGLIMEPNQEWSIKEDDVYSWKIVRCRDTKNQLKESTWGDTDITVTEGSILSIFVIDILESDILMLSYYTSNQNKTNTLFNLTNYLVAESLPYLGFSSFILPLDGLFWSRLEHNLSNLHLDNSIIRNDKLFYFKTRLGNLYEVEWTYEKETGLLYNFIEYYDSFITKHIERIDIMDILESSNKLGLFGGLTLRTEILNGLILIGILGVLIFSIKKKEQF